MTTLSPSSSASLSLLRASCAAAIRPPRDLVQTRWRGTRDIDSDLQFTFLFRLVRLLWRVNWSYRLECVRAVRIAIKKKYRELYTSLSATLFAALSSSSSSSTLVHLPPSSPLPLASIAPLFPSPVFFCFLKYKSQVRLKSLKVRRVHSCDMPPRVHLLTEVCLLLPPSPSFFFQRLRNTRRNVILTRGLNYP